MIVLVEMTYDEFLKLKDQKYKSTAVIQLICNKLKISVEQISSYDWYYGLKIYVYLQDDFVSKIVNDRLGKM